MASVIHLIRHLRPAMADVLLGQFDPPLATLEHAPLMIEAASIFSSPLLRARQTAEVCFPGREIVSVPALTEISLGEWDGLARAEIESKWPELSRAKLADWRTVTPPGGEGWREFERLSNRLGAASPPRPAHVQSWRTPG